MQLNLTPIREEKKKLDLTPLDLEPIEDPLIEAKKLLSSKQVVDDPINRNDVKEVKTKSFDDPRGEPDTWFGGFKKSLWDQTFGNNEMIESAAHPTTLGDFSNLMLPSGLPNVTRLVPSVVRNKLGNIAERVLGKSNEIIPENISSKGTVTNQNLPLFDENGKILSRGGKSLPKDLESTIPKPPVEVSPQFNPKGQTGKTGSLQLEEIPNVDTNTGELIEPVNQSIPRDITVTTLKEPTPELIKQAQEIGPDTIHIKSPTPETVKRAKQYGYEFETVTEDGRFKFNKAIPKPNQPLLESEVNIKRANKSSLGPEIDQSTGDTIKDVMNFPRAVMASTDMSAPLRQGLGLIHKKQFWTSLDDMFKAWGSENAFREVQNSIKEKPLFKRRMLEGKEIPSFAEDAGLKLTDLHDLTNKEEAFASNLAQKVPGVRRSERAYVAFLNKLRADTFEDLVTTGKVFGSDANTNVPLARELASFVNNATGRGDLGALERSATTLNSLFFSPRLIASRLQYMNPRNYIFTNPMVRKEYLKSLLAIGAAGNTVLQLGKMAGGNVETDPASSDFAKLKIGDARLDPWGGFQQYAVAFQRLAPHLRSFRNISSGIDPVSNLLNGLGDISVLGEKIGKTDTGIIPLDLITGAINDFGGRMKSTTTEREYDLGNPKFGQSSRLDVLGRFGRGKLNPVLGFIYSLLDSQRELSGQKMNLTTINPFDNAIAQRFIPIMLQDLYDLSYDDINKDHKFIPNELKPKRLLVIPAWFGAGIQQYKD